MVGSNHDCAAASELEKDLDCGSDAPAALAIACESGGPGRLQADALGWGESCFDRLAEHGAQEEAAAYGDGVFRIGELIAKLEKKYKM